MHTCKSNVEEFDGLKINVMQTSIKSMFKHFNQVGYKRSIVANLPWPNVNYQTDLLSLKYR